MRVNEIAATRLLSDSGSTLNISSTTTTNQFSRHFDYDDYEED